MPVDPASVHAASASCLGWARPNLCELGGCEVCCAHTHAAFNVMHAPLGASVGWEVKVRWGFETKGILAQMRGSSQV
eukprot:72446-Chlamydomonas_euryale.AAC.1